MVLSCNVQPAPRKESSHRVRVSQSFHALVKGTSAGLAAVSMLEDLGVDISKSTNNDRAVLEVRIDDSLEEA